jgi:hypothetical protein
MLAAMHTTAKEYFTLTTKNILPTNKGPGGMLPSILSLKCKP